MKVLWIGEIVLDKTYVISQEINAWQKCQSQDSLVSIWWPVPSALKLLNNIWCETTIVWTVWKWPLWRYVQDQFDSYWINHFLILDKSTKVNTVIIDEKSWSRTIIKDKIHNCSLKKIPLGLIKEADIIIFDRSEKWVFDYVLKNKNPDTKIIIDPSTEYSPEIIHMTRNSYVPIFPIETIYKLSDENDFQKNILKLYNIMWKTIVITDWENWAYIFDWKNLRNYESLKICPIDTDGAWDIFRGGFAYGLLNNWSIEDSVVFANKVAWLQCLKHGNLTAVPSLQEIESFTF